MLNQEKLLDYIRRSKKGDESAKEILFNENIPLIKSICFRFKNKGIEYDDLYQIACIGFVKAINNFDESFDVKFSTYTVPMIVGEIKRYIRDNGALKVSRSIKILSLKINKYIEEFQKSNNETPQIKQIAEYFECSEDDVVLALDSSRMPLSIYEKFEDDEEGQELIDKIASYSSEENLVDKIHVRNIIGEFNERDKKIIYLRFFRDETQSEVAKILNVSQVQVSRLENKILEKIRGKF